MELSTLENTCPQPAGMKKWILRKFIDSHPDFERKASTVILVRQTKAEGAWAATLTRIITSKGGSLELSELRKMYERFPKPAGMEKYELEEFIDSRPEFKRENNKVRLVQQIDSGALPPGHSRHSIGSLNRMPPVSSRSVGLSPESMRVTMGGSSSRR